MSPFALNLEKPKPDNLLVSVEPALNGFGSMLLLAKDEGSSPGIHEWVTKTRAQMTQDELFRHKLVIIGLHYAVIPTNNWSSFEAYLESLEKTPPSAFRHSLLNSYSKICITNESLVDKDKPVDWDEVLSSPANYVGFLKYRFGEELTDAEVETRAYEYVIDPAAMKQLITGHMRWFWKNHLQAEWTRVRNLLEESARAFNQLDYSDMTRADLMRYITGKEFEETKWHGEVEKSENLVFIPNAHLGPYIHTLKVKDTFYIYFGAHLPEGSEIHVPELDRAEIVGKLSALADETRLQILRMVAENGEMRSNEIMDGIKLSQPSVSRYLGQLTANGYLQERRVNGAKAYTLNRERIEKTLKAISAFLLDSVKV